MNPMFAAIKKRKAGGAAIMGDHQDVSHQAQHADDPSTESPHEDKSEGKDLHGLVASLSETEKGHLKTILAKDSGSAAQGISKGGASSDEKGKIAEQISKEDETNAAEAAEDNDGAAGHAGSDTIGASMLDSRFKGGGGEMKPRNLNDRMQMGIAAKLKAKGKL